MHVLRFGLENYRCFRDPVEVSFVATSQSDRPDFRIPSDRVEHGVLPVVGVYGANASGKSSVLSGLLALRDAVEFSFRSAPDRPVPWEPFRLDRRDDAPPTVLDLDFELDGVRYHYGFSHRGRGFEEEWLFQWTTHRRTVLFERDAGDDEAPFYFGPSLKGDKAHLARATRDNALFLSTAAFHNHDQLLPVFRAITQGIRRPSTIMLSGVPLFSGDDPILEERHHERVRKLLTSADVGCDDFQPSEVQLDQIPAELERVLRPEALDALRDRSEDTPLYEIALVRRDADGRTWRLPPDSESTGTRILLRRISDLLRHEPGLLVMDELETSLHPDLVRETLSLYTSRDANPSGRQLLFTAHDRGLLNSLRRDGLVLVDKDRDGVAHLTTASDFRDLRRRDALDRVHAQGRMGGVPVLDSFVAAWSS